jgi:hypothetical protein
MSYIVPRKNNLGSRHAPEERNKNNMPCLQTQDSQQRNDIKMPLMRRFTPNLGFRPETTPNQNESREAPTHLNDASKEENDAHRRHHRRHRPETG